MRASARYTSLRRRTDFSRVHRQGRRKGDELLQLRVLPYPPDTPANIPLRLGIIVSKKYGSAVERNRFKRLVRTALRNLAPEITTGWDILVLPREAHASKMPEMLASFRELLGALGLLKL
jgi:ribonuclease P protein component